MDVLRDRPVLCHCWQWCLYYPQPLSCHQPLCAAGILLQVLLLPQQLPSIPALQAGVQGLCFPGSSPRLLTCENWGISAPVGITQTCFIQAPNSPRLCFWICYLGCVITFLPRSKRLLILWLQSPSAVILEPPILILHLNPWSILPSFLSFFLPLSLLSFLLFLERVIITSILHRTVLERQVT